MQTKIQTTVSKLQVGDVLAGSSQRVLGVGPTNSGKRTLVVERGFDKVRVQWGSRTTVQVFRENGEVII